MGNADNRHSWSPRGTSPGPGSILSRQTDRTEHRKLMGIKAEQLSYQSQGREVIKSKETTVSYNSELHKSPLALQNTANKQESCLQRKSTSFSGAQEKPTRSGDTGTSREPWRAAGKAVVGPAAWAAPAPLQGPGASQHLRVQPGPPSQRSHLSARRHLEKLNVCLCESTLSQDNDPAASSSASPF